MAEEKLKKNRRTKEIEEDIYALDLRFDDVAEEENELLDAEEIGNIEDTEEIDEQPKKKKVLAKIEEGIKSSKIGDKKASKKETKKETKKASVAKEAKATKTSKRPVGRPRKNGEENVQSEIKMHTENNITEIKLRQNKYKVEMQRNEFNIYTEDNDTSYIIVREPSLRIVAGTVYILLERQDDDYAITTNQDFKINYLIDNLQRRDKIVNFKLTNLTQIEADEDGLTFEIDEQKVIENNLEDNKTLIISEEDGKVYLPYTKEEIKSYVAENKGVKIGELIEENYILPLDKYKNSMKARFREGYNLMRKKEGKSRKSAFMLGLELMFESNLHPAIISACKTLEELDIYLDCLEDNELEKFSCFKIIYKSLPTLRKSRKSEEF